MQHTGGRPLIDKLLGALYHDPLGLCGHRDPVAKVAAVEDEEARLRVLALGSVLADSLAPSAGVWAQLAALHDHWLLDPSAVAYRPSPVVAEALAEAGIGGPRHAARVWWQICRGFQGRFRGSIRQMLRACGDDAVEAQMYLTESPTTFPVLSGPVVSAAWLDRVHRTGGVALDRWPLLVVELAAGDQAAAAEFGISSRLAHPQERWALRVWRAACQGSPPGACGLKACPRRPVP